MNMKVFISQINPTVGDLAGNLKIIQQGIANAVQAGCDVIVFPELATTGYPPRDLLYSKSFWDDHAALIAKLSQYISQIPQQITVIVGGLHQEMQTGGRHARYNAAWIIDKHFGTRVVHKRLLPCYDVFDETRYFSSAEDDPYCPIPIHIVQKRSGLPEREYDVPCDVLICEDIWNNRFRGGESWMKPATYLTDPLGDIALHGKGPLFVLNGSPFWIGKIQETERLLIDIAKRLQQPVVWVNQVGAHDDIITGGYSMVALPEPRSNNSGQVVSVRRGKAFEEDSMIVRFSDERTHHSNLNEGRYDIHADLIEPATLNHKKKWNSDKPIDKSDFDMWTVYKALFLHMTDYKRRCGFKRAVLGLSGGIDSAVVAVIAAHVFGSENVTSIAMPSPYSSEGSVTDARSLADNLKIRFQVKRITAVYESVKDLFLSGVKQKFDSPLTDENIQPRVRGMILMAHSNEYDPCLLLTTGNKSEITVGYMTIYGDMCGGLAVISDLWKTEVYKLARFMNKYFDEPIPKDTIEKPASAELRPDQKDTDSLPPYEVLDPLLQLFVEQEMLPFQVFATDWFKEHQGTGRNTVYAGLVKEMYGKYRNSEYKRQQMPVGPKLSARSYGAGRRMPIACKITCI